MEHICSWRHESDWREEPAENGWRIVRLYKHQRCSECDAVKSARVTDDRRKNRIEIRQNSRPPATLLKIVSVKQWQPLDKILKAVGGNRLDLELLLGEWLREGWIQVEERREPYHNKWQVTKARLSEAAHKELIEQPQLNAQTHRQEEIEALLLLLKGWRTELTIAQQIWNGDNKIEPLLNRLELILARQEDALQNQQWVALPDTNQRPGGTAHQRWLRIARGLVALLVANQWQYERTFSAHWLDDSKQLMRNRQLIEQYLDIKLEDVGLFRHTPIVYCWGPFEATHNGRSVNGKAGSPFIALTAETIRELTELQVRAESIIVIENQTAFETMLRAPLRQDNVLYLFSGGHAGLAERKLLFSWLHATPNISWWVWTDWDLGGVRIQMDWDRWAISKGLPSPHPWKWDEHSLIRWRSFGQALRDSERDKLLNLSHPLAEELVRAGYTLEQEAVLSALVPDDLNLAVV